VGLQRGPLSLVSTTEQLLGRKISGYGLEIRDYSRGDPLRWPRGTLYLYGRMLGFLNRSRYYFFQVAPQLYSRGRVDQFQAHYFSENLVASGIQPGPLDLQPGTLTTRPQGRSTFFYITYINSVRTSQEAQYISVL
jgi:hypothetical protein